MQNYPCVTEYMTTNLVTFRPEMDIHEAIDILLSKKISGAPVINEDRLLVGMLSEADCLRILLEVAYGNDPLSVKMQVGDYMSVRLKTISASKTILEAAYEFVHSGYKRLPVIQNDALVGQLSRVDVLRAVQKMKPETKHVPDSWKGREPIMPEFKKTHYNKNA